MLLKVLYGINMNHRQIRCIIGNIIPESYFPIHQHYVKDSDAATVGAEYGNHDGWVLIVPQENDGTLSICYTLNNVPDMIFEKNIPAITYEAGKQYNYILTISGSEVDLTLKIADWNLLDSSYDIVL